MVGEVTKALNNAAYTAARPMADGAGVLVTAGTKVATHGLEEMHWIFGGGIAIAIEALLHQWDYEHQKKLIRDQYESEIAAKLGIRAEDVRDKDLQEVAETNPAIKEALRYARWKRNFEIAVAGGLTILSFAITGGIIAAVPAITGILEVAVGLATGVATFYFGDKLLHAVGEKPLGLKEPDLHEVEYNPQLQHEMSVPGQIHFLTRLQHRNTPITQDQIITVLVAANPTLAEQINERYGAPFAELPASMRTRVMEQVGPNYQLDELTEDINTHRVRAQELAFKAYGQTSGVPKLETPQHTLLERAHADLQQKLAMAHAKIGELHEKVNAQAAHIADKAKDVAQTTAGKLGFGKSQASLGALGTVADAPEQAVAQSQEPLGKFTAMHRPRVSTSGSLAEQILADRQQQAGLQSAVSG